MPPPFLERNLLRAIELATNPNVILEHLFARLARKAS